MSHIIQCILSLFTSLILCLLIRSNYANEYYYYRWGQLHFLYYYIFWVFTKKTAQGKPFKFHNACDYTIKNISSAMGNIFSMYQPSEQELKRQVKDLVVALQLEGTSA